MYIPKAYPCWLYHRSEPARIVETHEQREALGDEWATHPDLLAKAPAAVDETPAVEHAKPATRKKASNGGK